MKRYIFFCEQLSVDEYESLYKALDNNSFMTIPKHNRIIEAFWDNKEAIEDVIQIPATCNYVCS